VHKSNIISCFALSMSRSRRHMPIIGNTSSKSEKDDKQRAAMRERKRMNDVTKPHLAADADFEIARFAEHPRSGGWIFGKDGKHYLHRPDAKALRK
jgi:hypothetical protein